ncbi:MAG: TonB-dependent receptor [Melioribacteraceae bacterium]|nr:TonB-dependent receptor [Melioribacteraceae bacterium]MCF8354894.1 TonB-dependent receptor [Melioribacteraceae bacterium]MCF8393884.1 TonB-dependent receptor [Melioribacteraceae bacterium]MCF8419656.1 TonB-dependent receptor [Melioribacteraceae bacterium]
MDKKILRRGMFFILAFLLSVNVWAGQTGKLSGYIVDSETGEAVIGANIILEGTYLGAAADLEGYYFINNIQPGKYTVIVSAVGYQKTRVTDVIIKIDLTTELDIDLRPDVLELGQEVVIQAERPLIQKDLTSTSVTVSSDEIKMLPVENVSQIVNLQAGVVGGHFRGGRLGEVAYLIDGLPVTDAYNGNISVEVENSSIRQLEVISGTFNAEYGQALSGVVNIVTKEGSSTKYEGYASAFVGSYLADGGELFQNANKLNPKDGPKDVQASISGPTKILDGLTFFLTGRYFRDEGYLYGKRVYNVDDVNYFTPTGDGEYVPMNPYEKKSFNGKLTYSLPKWKFSYSAFYDLNWNKYYDHSFRWTPDGLQNHYRDNFIQSVQIAFFPTPETFTSLKFSYNQHDYKGYLYEDPFDERYVHPIHGNPTSGYTFRQGGNQTGRYKRQTKTLIGQWTVEAQVSKEHKVKLGVEGRLHEMFDHGWGISDRSDSVDFFGNPVFMDGPTYPDLHTPGNQQYRKFPYELAAFIQDKVEYKRMIINAGVRIDYFNSNSTLPADLRNPLNNQDFPGYNEYVDSEPEQQISPRLGVAFPISDQGAIYFSYGHFLQIPRFENLYVNDEYIIRQGASLSSYTGNPNLKVERRVQYEVGLQQVIFPNVSLDLTAYYSDIRNLLGMEIINTYEGLKYARFINRDYGNVKGFTVAFDKRFADYFGAKLDYTFQVAEGNASDPFAVYNDNQTDPPVESEKKLVPLNWDQRSTLNLTANVGEPGNWMVGIIFQYGSGQPYTEDIRISNGVRFENGGIKPATFNLDLKADKFFDLWGITFHTYLWVYNLLDIRNEYGVYGTTGRANVDLNTKFAGDINGLNTIDQFVNNPGMYNAPRQIRLGISFSY